VASAGGGTIDVLQGGCEGFRSDPGTLVCSCVIEATGGSQDWSDVDCSIDAAGGVHDLCLRFGGSGDQILNLDYYYFE
jgi:arabinoxylan arabinofuranohydrolase